jgi:hypothetical protein
VIWKTWRENRRLVLGYLSLALLFVAVEGALTWRVALTQGPIGVIGTLARMALVSEEAQVILPGIMGFFVAIVLGVEIGLRDFENRVERFWQARPIPMAAYFRTRYALGLVFALGMAAIPALLAYAMASGLAALAVAWWQSDFGTMNYTWQIWEFLVFYAPQAVLVYGVSVLAATLTHRRVVSMVFGLAVALGLQLIFGLSEEMSVWPGRVLGDWNWALGYWVIIGTALMGLGWLAGLSIRHHWRERFDAALVAGPKASG